MPRVNTSVYGERAHRLLDSETTQRICDMIRGGSFVSTAAAHAGITESTLQGWLKRGRREIQRREHLADVKLLEAAKDEHRVYELRVEEETRRDVRDIVDSEKALAEQPFVDFVIAVDTAIAESELADLTIINKAARGGHVVERVVIEEDGKRKEVLKYTQPDWHAARWKMERRHRQKWGKEALEISGPGGKPIEVAHSWADAVKMALKRQGETREVLEGEVVESADE